MADSSGAVRQQGAEQSARRDALAYWYLQETTPLDPGDASYGPCESTESGDERMAAGWWLVPALLLSGPAWYGLYRLVF